MAPFIFLLLTILWPFQFLGFVLHLFLYDRYFIRPAVRAGVLPWRQVQVVDFLLALFWALFVVYVVVQSTVTPAELRAGDPSLAARVKYGGFSALLWCSLLINGVLLLRYDRAAHGRPRCVNVAFVGGLLLVAIPLGYWNLTEALKGLESNDLVATCAALLFNALWWLMLWALYRNARLRPDQATRPDEPAIQGMLAGAAAGFALLAACGVVALPAIFDLLGPG